ncbi:leucyl aminopeptidase family protein [Sandaracinobacteroides sp. A072]|uniref:leucyl aminopeptidase family protein n=1 Tax=Sandaracinobacteroides sp. A072 TaxID=3461146 RepID=UPI0040414C25
MRLAPLAALLLLGVSAEAIAQERPSSLVGTGVAPSEAKSSAERPIRFASAVPAGSALVIPVMAPLAIAKAAPGLPAESADAIQRAADTAKFEPDTGKTLMLHGVGGHPAVLLVGLKPEGEAPAATELADAGGTAIQALRMTPHDIAVLAGGLPAASARSLALGVALGQYRYDALQSTAKAPPQNPVTIVAPDGEAEGRAFAADGAHVAEGVRFARDLVTMPANTLWPERFVELSRQALAGVPNVRITVLDEAQMRQMKMGSILSVSAGSKRPARILAIEYRGGGNDAPLALVGKGITFDTGGISLKQNNGMWEMKGDMSGAAAVTGAVLAAAKRKAKANIVAVAALAENMPGGNATRPGDVVRTMNGPTIEIWSTDAEGRMVLADANQWAIRQFSPSGLVNIATLTGSIVGALGPDFAGLFARDETLAARVAAAGESSSEKLWRMPLLPVYQKRMASEIADIRNSGGGTGPGAGLGAHFIHYLTPQPTPWAHVDMAAVDRADPALPTVPKGPRGFGVRLFDELIRSYER